jgi:hypothetical protein
MGLVTVRSILFRRSSNISKYRKARLRRALCLAS